MRTFRRHSVFQLILALGMCGTVVGSASAQEEEDEDDHPYLGLIACKRCHMKQFKSWSETKMARTFEILRPGKAAASKKRVGLDPKKDYTKDEKCLPCHVTGYGKDGGYGDAMHNDQLEAVGCEACHGPGGDYVRNDRMSKKNDSFKSADLERHGFVRRPSEKTCVGCHNERSPFFQGFDFKKASADRKATHAHFKLEKKH